jgi:hypothetical protein
MSCHFITFRSCRVERENDGDDQYTRIDTDDVDTDERSRNGPQHQGNIVVKFQIRKKHSVC